MIWKTDWSLTDNYARSGAADLARLCDNYAQLANIAGAIKGQQIPLQPVTVNAYFTLPFADVLNAVETNMNALHVWPAPWVEKNITWQPAEQAPNYADINRWEQNGKSIEDTATFLSDYRYQLVAKTFFAGNNRAVQIFSRGRL